MWKVNILSLFPQIFPGPLAYSITGKAMLKGLWELKSHNIRDYATDKHKTVDDTPYGGGQGMIIKPDVLGRAIEDLFLPNAMPIFYLSPRGRVFNQSIAHELIDHSEINLICGRFEGIDERVITEYKIQELSIGDYVLSSGDTAALVIMDTCIRLIPGVLRDTEAVLEESFGLNSPYSQLLEHPQYTKPSMWKKHPVPAVLLSGNHSEVKKWRIEQAILKTKVTRPDLWYKYTNYYINSK